MINDARYDKSEAPSNPSLGGISLALNQNISPQDLAKKLTDFGYESAGTDNVHAHGQFSKRGGVVDLLL